KSVTTLRFLSSDTAEMTPRGLYRRKYTLRSFSIWTPSTSILSDGVTLTPNSLTVFPFTFTFPSRIICSALRLDAIPACAITFCNLSISCSPHLFKYRLHRRPIHVLRGLSNRNYGIIPVKEKAHRSKEKKTVNASQSSQ